MTKSWYSSKTKLGGVVGGVGTVLVATGGALSGEIDTIVAVEMVIGAVGVILVCLGVRDALSNLE